MQETYLNNDTGERVVEIPFILEMLKKYGLGKKVLDVGGIPTAGTNKILELSKEMNISYKICDFRGGDFKGNFVELNIPEKFDIIIFLSSLEHFSLCTEGDMNFRLDYDKKGIEKAVSLLNNDGIILLTVPFGEPVWQPYHQNYDLQKIKELGNIKIMDNYCYKLCYDNQWIRTTEDNFKNIYYTNKAFGVGCFVLKGN